nr:hypothetical protein [Candidatus Freyarchaeota archaeon]
MTASKGSKMSKMIQLVELNLGRWKMLTVAIIDINYKVWGQKGEILPEVFEYYKKFPLKEMHVGDSVHNNNTFLMKVTEKTGIIVGMDDMHLARLAAINLRGRIGALSEFYKLEKFIGESKRSTRLGDAAEEEKRIW